MKPQTKTERLWTLIPCGGNGSRAGSVQPKQYQQIAGKPLVLHTLAAFLTITDVQAVAIGVANGDDFLADLFLDDFFIRFDAGQSRAATVFKGLQCLYQQGADAQDWVLVHDAARCLVTPELIERLIAACIQDDTGGLLAMPLPDTLKIEHQNRVQETVSRHDKWLAQTPQMFRLGDLFHALETAGDLTHNTWLTDESSAMERLGHLPKLVRGSALNFKVTYPEDFAFAQTVLESRLNSNV